MSVISKTGKVTHRSTDLAIAHAPKAVQVGIAYEKTRKLTLNGRYAPFFADVSRLLSAKDMQVLFHNPVALTAYSSEPCKSGAIALLQFCVTRWEGVKSGEKVAFAALCKEILAALTK